MHAAKSLINIIYLNCTLTNGHLVHCSISVVKEPQAYMQCLTHNVLMNTYYNKINPSF